MGGNVLDIEQLQEGDRCLYKRQKLTYEQTVVGRHPTYLIFRTPKGIEKRLSQSTVERDVWVEINLGNLEAK